MPETLVTIAYLAAGLLFFLGFDYFGVFLTYEAASLLAAVLFGGLEWHPVSRLYWGKTQTITLNAAVYVAPDTELIPCPECGRLLHPRSEKCVHCGKELT